MTISDQLLAIQAALAAYCDSQGKGQAVICSDFAHYWEALLQGPQTLRCLIVFGGEVPRETFDGGSITNRVDRKFHIAVTRARGFNLARGDTLVTQTQQGDPLFDIAEDVRDLCRGILFDPGSAERPTEYKGIEAMAQAQFGQIVDAYQVTIQTGVDIPAMVATDPNGSGLIV